MFFCQITGKTSQPGDKINKIVIEKREKVYYQRSKSSETGRFEDVEVGRGYEIVREINATEEGVAEWHAMTEVQQKNHIANL